MSSHISKISRDSAKLISVLDKNIDTVVAKINSGQTTLIKEIENREHEVNVLMSIKSKNHSTNKNNKLRIEYVEMEIYVLTSIGRLYDMINKDNNEAEIQDNVE